MKERKEIIAFGAGEDSRKFISFLKLHHNIQFLADNDQKKQGTSLDGYIIKSSAEIKDVDYDVVITTSKYACEIKDQLQREGISQKRLYYCRQFCIENELQCEVCPVDEEELKDTGIQLKNYDLYQLEEDESACKKVLIFCIFFSTYAKQLIENILKRYKDIEFSLLTGTKNYQDQIATGCLKHIYYFRSMSDLKTILKQLPVYDAMQLLWIEWEWSFFYKLVRAKTMRLNLNVGGSDFYRTENSERIFRKNIIACADCITAETEATVLEFGEYYGDNVKKKLSLLPFGIEVLEWIKQVENIPLNVIKKKYHIPYNKIVITCGHNAIEKHQHIKMIEILEELPEKIKEQAVFVFPMTYPQGYEAYISRVESKLKYSQLEYVILTEFMDFKGMAEYALLSDIMIHVQETDQLSSTMLEEMYAGSIVIAGKWLPYGSLHEMGMYFIDVEDITHITFYVENIITHLDKYRDKCSVNREIIWKHSSWDVLAPKWHALWA